MAKQLTYTLLFFTIIIFSSCNNNKSQFQNRIGELSETNRSILQDDTIELQDTNLIARYQSEIEQFYSKYFKDKNEQISKPDLKLQGYISYNDKDLLIISFDEVLKYGSWHYSHSSIAFKKLENNKLLRIKVSNSDLLASSQIDHALMYPNRISGIPSVVTDLNNNGEKDIIFESSVQIRSTEYKTYSIYFSKDKTMKLSKCLFSGEIDQCCDGNCGEEKTVRILYFDSLPIILVNTKIIECMEGQEKRTIIKESHERYQWNEKKDDFEIKR